MKKEKENGNQWIFLKRLIQNNKITFINSCLTKQQNKMILFIMLLKSNNYIDCYVNLALRIAYV